MKRITVLLADDHTVFRQGLRALLSLEDDIEIVGEAQSGREAVQLTKKLHPEVVIMDIAMPLLNGLEATRQILKAFPATKVIILSAHNDDAYVEQVIALGAGGYLRKQSSGELLSRAIRDVLKGKSCFSPSIAKRFGDLHRNSPDRRGRLKKRVAGLSSREMEVLQLIVEGKANKEVAAELGISIKTVEKHRQHLMEKLNIHDVAGLVRYAISTGIVESSVQFKIT